MKKKMYCLALSALVCLLCSQYVAAEEERSLDAHPNLKIRVDVKTTPTELTLQLLSVSQWFAENPPHVSAGLPVVLIAAGDAGTTAGFVAEVGPDIAIEFKDDGAGGYNITVTVVATPQTPTGNTAMDGMLSALFNRVRRLGSCAKDKMLTLILGMTEVSVTLELDLGPTGGAKIKVTGKSTGQAVYDFVQDMWSCWSGNAG